MDVHLSSKSRHRKGNSAKAPFSPVLNGAFIAQSSSRTIVIEEVDIAFQQRRDILGMGQIEVEIEFFFDPAVKGLDNRVVCGSSPSRHRAKYVIIMVGLAKSP